MTANTPKDILTKRIRTANKDVPADVVIKNGRIIDVFNMEVLEADIAITEGTISGIGEYDGNEVIDAHGKYIAPAFIDGHVHIESSMVPPEEFARVVLPHGVTTIVTDPHEVANVCGNRGIQFMLDQAKDTCMDMHFMLPSCVPATPFENAGARLMDEDLRPYYDHPQVLGLAEVMDYPSLRSAAPDLIGKLTSTTLEGKKIDGHLAGLDPHAINIYRAAGVLTDHECNTPGDALERIRRGMYVMMREGSVAKDLLALLPAVKPHNSRRFFFCTDDKHIDDLLRNGSIDHHVRLAIANGTDPITAIQMASLNAAECYGLTDKGAVAPGYKADLILFDDLNDPVISDVYKEGKHVAKNGSYIGPAPGRKDLASAITNTVHLPELSEVSLKIPMESSKANVIKINPNSLRTDHNVEHVQVENGSFLPSVEEDQLKLAAVERHHQTGNIGLGVVKGLGLKRGAIATTIAHDSHNIVAVGTNDHDMIQAIKHLSDINGGLAVVVDGKPVASLSLPIGGLMSDKTAEEVNAALDHVHHSLKEQGFQGDFNPFLTLSFLTLPVIPSLKLTDKGLFDVTKLRHIDVSCS
ncbi:adenine deaminase [Halobacillus sp. BAB-2008]|uniref:adenine deaminase n=1 Tax=Halobacillus sp. BAB-2008 TaxID=1246484 RepID=UPI0002A4D467|nr:adenine deaminase [Halobacillus sp. BAB-2008]ELK47557.1 adenine deaminase [Halobacillus sp. BAB-2008]